MNDRKYIERTKDRLNSHLCGRNNNNQELLGDVFAMSLNSIEIQQVFIKSQASDIQRLESEVKSLKAENERLESELEATHKAYKDMHDNYSEICNEP